MTYRKVSKWPSRSVLGTCEPVKNFDDNLRSLVIDMIDTCNVDNGIGLAANQIDSNKRVVVIKPSAFGFDNGDPCEYNEDFMVLVNPQLKNSEDAMTWTEACLSLPGIEGKVERFTETHVDYCNLDGDPKQLIAEWPFSGGIQHECDHLDGKLFVSRMKRGSRSMALQKFRKIEKKKIREKKREARELKKSTSTQGRTKGRRR